MSTNFKLESAATALKNAEGLINDEGSGPRNKNATIRRIREILGAAHKVVLLFEGLSELAPPAKAAVTLYKSLVQLELDRGQNEMQVVAIYQLMATGMFSLRCLWDHRDESYDSAERLHEGMTAMYTIMQEFGEFVDVYYTKSKLSRIFRLLRSEEFKQELGGFARRFIEQQDQIQLAVSVHIYIQQAGIGRNVQQLLQNTDKIISTLGSPANKAESDALTAIQKQGGPDHVIHDDAALKKIADMLKEHMTSSTRAALRDSIENLVASNTHFSSKLQAAEMTITEAIARSNIDIMAQLSKGAHNAIADQDVKQLWEDNHFNMNVKCRQFVEALCSHYAQKLGPDADEAWALRVLRKVIYHPSIGEAIDEDASGFLSVHEVNHFVQKRPNDISTILWFTFWAVGWQIENIYDTGSIGSLLKGIRQAAAKAKTANSKNQEMQTVIDMYVGVLEYADAITDWYDATQGTPVDDLDKDAESELTELRTKLSAIRLATLRDGLKGIDYSVSDAALLPVVTKEPGMRIEHHILPLLILILEKHKERIVAGRVSDSAWLDMYNSLVNLVNEFHSRMASLKRSWRSQKLDIETQLSCFASGLFMGWYKKMQEQEAQDWLSAQGDNEEEYYDEADADESTTAATQAPAVTLDTLSARVDGLERMLQRLLDLAEGRAGTQSSTAATKQPIARQGNDAPERGGEEEPSGRFRSLDPDENKNEDANEEGYGAALENRNRGEDQLDEDDQKGRYSSHVDSEGYGGSYNESEEDQRDSYNSREEDNPGYADQHEDGYGGGGYGNQGQGDDNDWQDRNDDNGDGDEEY